MAHAAVFSLINTLKQLLDWQLAEQLWFHVMQLGDLQQRAISLRVFLEESSQNSSQEVKSLETKISIWAYHSEDTIESWMSDHLRRGPRTTNLPNVPDTPGEIKSRKKLVKPMDLHKINAEHDTIMEELVKIKDWSGKHNRRPMNNLPSRPARSWGQTTMVGFDVELMQIKERLCNDHQQPKLQILPIVGMGGIGKTIVARNVYNDPFVVHHFYICAWITLSQHYQLREILLNLLEDIGLCIDDKIRKENDEKLMELIYKSVKGKRFLVVLDDMWSTSAWNDIKMLFPDDNNGSRILVTTRLVDVAEYVGSCGTCHHMRFLDEEESWNLFCQKVFGEAECPFELVDVGMNIAKNCQGLPLAIVVIGGLLLNSNKGKEFWEFVAVNISSVLTENDERCSEIFSLSYNNLLPHLKPCFLYMGVFPQNYEIPVSRLIKLWTAEGFLSPYPNKCQEKVAEHYLMELISRNLVFVSQKGSLYGKIKSCRMLDVLREFCVRMAQEENFLYVKNRHHRKFPKEASYKRRLSIHDDAAFSATEEEITMDFVRSFIYNGWDDTLLHSYYCFGYLLLRVLDMFGVELQRFPEELLQLVHLRYIAIACCAEIPGSIVVLWNLQTLIAIDPMGIASKLPKEIWDMPQLRHLKFSRVSLPPFNPEKPFTLRYDLQTLSGLDNLNLDILIRYPFLKKLGLHCNPLSFRSPLNIGFLNELETIKILFDTQPDSSFVQHITLPQKLKKITLDGGSIDWEYMKTFGFLPKLEVLKLRGFAFRGPEWLPNEGEFLKLKFLLICDTDLVHWRAENTHFPRLEHLILRNCSNLEEIPSSIGEISTLATIVIDNSSPSAVASANQILEDQRDLGNDYLQVFVHPTRAKFYPLKFRI